jgi:RimJ/RimL family protein N-acetyltransferase
MTLDIIETRSGGAGRWAWSAGVGDRHMAEDRSLVETERLILRPFEAGDTEELYRLVYADPEVREAWSGYRETLEQFRRRFAEGGVWRVEDGFGFRAVILKEGGVLLGLMGFQRHQDEPGIVLGDGARPVASDPDLVDVELTYALGRAYWKRGYATEAGAALIAMGFDRLGIDRIINWVDPHNANTIGLMRRLGFRIEPNRNPDDLSKSGAPSVLGILERMAEPA